MIRSQLIISSHARRRLAERVPEIPAKNYSRFVSAARYNGISLKMLSEEDQQEFRRSHLVNNSNQVRFHRGYVFIFGGNDHKARTLITVYKYALPSPAQTETASGAGCGALFQNEVICSPIPECVL